MAMSYKLMRPVAKTLVSRADMYELLMRVS